MEIDVKNSDITLLEKKVCVACSLIQELITSKITYIIILHSLAIYLIFTTNNRIVMQTSLMWAVACLILGTLIGFLFALPKRTNKKNKDDDEPSLLPNTNLQEVSDWLTKIIVGIGLVEFNKISNFIHVQAMEIGKLSQGADKIDYSMYAMALIIFYSISGFLMGYLGTRLGLSKQMYEADNATLGKLKKDIADINERVQLHESISSMITVAERNMASAKFLMENTDQSEEIREKIKRQLDLAEIILKEILDTDPHNIPATISLAYYYNIIEDPKYKDAVEVISKAIDFIKYNPCKSESDTQTILHRLYYNRACCLFKKENNFNDAKPDLLLALEARKKFYKRFVALDQDWNSVREDPEFKKLFQ